MKLDSLLIKPKPPITNNSNISSSFTNTHTTYQCIKHRSIPFYNLLFDYLNSNEISIELAKEIFPKVIKYEIEYINKKIYYINDLNLLEAFYKYKLEEIKCFNNEFELFYNKQIKDNSFIDINTNLNSKTLL